MALMFAIFKYRPSPFCLLDEIDAPLDDANIGRFVEMLQGMQEHTQFILITHNRKTMEIADRLVRRDDGGARRVEADFGAVELSRSRQGVHDCQGLPAGAGLASVTRDAPAGQPADRTPGSNS